MANSTGVNVRSRHFNEIFTTYYNTLIETFRLASKREDLPDYLRWNDTGWFANTYEFFIPLLFQLYFNDERIYSLFAIWLFDS